MWAPAGGQAWNGGIISNPCVWENHSFWIRGRSPAYQIMVQKWKTPMTADIPDLLTALGCWCYCTKWYFWSCMSTTIKIAKKISKFYCPINRLIQFWMIDIQISKIPWILLCPWLASIRVSKSWKWPPILDNCRMAS